MLLACPSLLLRFPTDVLLRYLAVLEDARAALMAMTGAEAWQRQYRRDLRGGPSGALSFGGMPAQPSEWRQCGHGTQ